MAKAWKVDLPKTRAMRTNRSLSLLTLGDCSVAMYSSCHGHNSWGILRSSKFKEKGVQTFPSSQNAPPLYIKNSINYFTLFTSTLHPKVLPIFVPFKNPSTLWLPCLSLPCTPLEGYRLQNWHLCRWKLSPSWASR